ncbi:MAG: helix-turn-helix transcriptional regulator [Anaerolineae bacterium]
MKRDYDKQYEAFLLKLRQAREEARLTQEEAAQRLEKPQSFISKCESGSRRVDFVELVMFAQLYSKPLDFFGP